MSSNPSADAATVTAYQAQTTDLRFRIEEFVRQLWQSLGVYREPQMRDFQRQVIPMIQGGQQQMVSLTAAYLAEVEQAVTGKPARIPALSKLAGAETFRRGVTPDDVYGRPFHTVWRSLADAQAQRDKHFQWTGTGVRPALPPENWPQLAVNDGLDQALTLAATDLQLAKTTTSQNVLQQATNVTGYARVLEGAHSCGLCIVASTHTYHKAELLPIHPGCDCGVRPLIAGEAPPQQALSDVHQAIADRFGKANAGARVISGQVRADGKPLTYKDVLIVHQHGEIGPVLGVRGQDFTGPADLH